MFLIIDFLKENWLFLTIVLSIILIMTVIYLLVDRKNKRLLDKYNRESQASVESRPEEVKISLQDLIDHEMVTRYENEIDQQKEDSTPESQTIANADPFEKPEAIEDMPKVIEPVPLEKKADEPKQEPAKQSPIKKAADLDFSEEDTLPASSEKKSLGRYHVLYRKEDKMWYVKREGSNRILRVLPTQREAVAFATIKAITQNTSFVIHKQDGKIRKQN